MVSTLALALLFGFQDVQKTAVVKTSLFKNGYAVVVRQAPLTHTETLIEGLPIASIGTLWISASPGIKLEEVVRIDRETETETNAASLDEVLTSNVGKQVTIRLPDDKSITGIVQSVSGAILILTTETRVEAVPKSAVQGVLGEGLSWKVKGKAKTAALRIKARFEAGTAGGGNVIIMALQRGMTWVPSYAVDISDSKRLSIVGKATILNDLADLSGVEVRLITGFPNIPYKTVLDPLTGGQSVDQFVSVLMKLDTPAEFKQVEMDMAFQGRAGGAPRWDESFDPTGLAGLQAEDLFFYRQPNVTLKKGERGYYVLFRGESDYEHIYTWDIGDPMEGDVYRGLPEQQGDVWHSLKFKNTTTLPWTTATAVTVKDGEILGQDVINYTSIGTDALLKITKALDVRADQSEEELNRERSAIVVPDGPSYDLVTLKGTLEITNRKTEKIKLRITKDLTGEVISAEGEPTIKKTAKGLRDVNTRQRIEWVKDIEAGKRLTLTYTYKVYVSSRGR